MAFEIGHTVADYEIVGLLGAGAVAEVYKVKHRVTGRLEAMKVLHRRGLGGRQVERFLREIKLQAGLSHPNIASVRTALEIDGELLMIMEYVDGQSLRAILEVRDVEGRQALDYALQALAALDYAHRRGITHRDVTPSNMLITAEGKLKLTDFGLAKATGDPTLTQTGTPLGSLYYMSPEHVRGLGEADQQSDIYSLGAVLYELITGRPPFDGKNAFEVMRAQVEQEPRPPQDLVTGLDGGLNETVQRALAKDPRDRFASASDFREAVLQARQMLKQPWSRTPRIEASSEAGESVPGTLPPAGETAAPESAHQKQPLPAALLRWWAPALGAGLAVAALVFLLWPRPAEEQTAVDRTVAAIAAASPGPAAANVSEGSQRPLGLEDESGPVAAGEPPAGQAETQTNGAGPDNPAQTNDGAKPPTPSRARTPSPSRAEGDVAVARSGNGAPDLTVAGTRPAPETTAAGSAANSPPDDTPDEENAEGPRLLQSLRAPRLLKLAVTADGTRLAGAAEDRIVRIWNPGTGRLLMEFEGHSVAITALTFTPDGRQLASGDASGLLKLWDLDLGRDFAALSQRGAVQFISFSRDGEWMAAGSSDKSVGLWKRTSQAAAPHWERALKGHKQSPIVGAFSPDSSHVVTASNEDVLRVWPVAGDGEPRRVAGLEGGIGELSYSTNGRWLATAGERSLTIWDAAHYEQARQVDVRSGRHVVAFTPEGLCLVASATFRTLFVWEATSGAEIAVLDADVRVESMALTPSGDRLMVADANGGLRIWEIPAPDPDLLRTRSTPSSTLQSSDAAPDQDAGKTDKLPGLARRVVDLFR
ncbi:MAG TPA: protein kinase [Bryobacterales bacterium]|nr:protein kinase [Bryobacterales bacterium]